MEQLLARWCSGRVTPVTLVAALLSVDQTDSGLQVPRACVCYNQTQYFTGIHAIFVLIGRLRTLSRKNHFYLGGSPNAEPPPCKPNFLSFLEFSAELEISPNWLNNRCYLVLYLLSKIHNFLFPAPTQSIFAFSRRIRQMIGWRPSMSGKSWIRHWLRNITVTRYNSSLNWTTRNIWQMMKTTSWSTVYFLLLQ